MFKCPELFTRPRNHPGHRKFGLNRPSSDFGGLLTEFSSAGRHTRRCWRCRPPKYSAGLKTNENRYVWDGYGLCLSPAPLDTKKNGTWPCAHTLHSRENTNIAFFTPTEHPRGCGGRTRGCSITKRSVWNPYDPLLSPAAMD